MPVKFRSVFCCSKCILNVVCVYNIYSLLVNDFLMRFLIWIPQANIARDYGARVYCVGVKDFDENQVSAFLKDPLI